MYKDCLQKGDGITFDDKNSSGGVINVIETCKNYTYLTIAGKMPEYSDKLQFHKNYDAGLMKKYSKYYSDNVSVRKVPVSVEIDIYTGSPCLFKLSDDTGITILETSDIICEYSESGTNVESVSKKATEFGNTPFKATDVKIHTDGHSFIPFSALKELRRNAASRLCEARKVRVLQ